MTKNGTQKPFKRWLRVTSFLTLTAFISTSFGMPVSAAASEINVPVKAKAPLSSLTIPENLGTLEEMFLGGDGRFVVLLQDAHAIPDAQKNAAEIIAHLQKNYSVNQVAVEGASDFFDTRFLKSFPDKEKLQKVMDEYMSRGELTGAGLAAVFDSGGAVFQGIEDWDLYEKADGLFLKALGLQETALKTLQENKSELKIQKRKIYSSQLFETDELLSNYENGSEDFLGVLEKFFAVQVPAEGTELRVLYDHLSRAGRDGENLAKEVRKQAADIQKQLNARKNPAKSEDLLLFNKELQNFQVSALSPREFAGWLINFASEKGVPVEFPENWMALARDEARLKNLEGSKVFEEFELYTAAVKEKLFRSQEERNLDSASRRLRSAEKLVKLELSPKDWGELKNDKKLQSEFPVNFDFYKNAEERDEVFFKKLKSMTASKEAAVFMAGGFHTQGLKELLQKENISFAVVRPQIKSIPDKEIYLNQMRGEVSWKKYFEPQNGKVNLFRAFMRGTRDELVKGGSGFLLKDWRDQIIRDLSAQKKIENASFYTSLLDETVSSEKEKQPLWIEKINRVISGLKTLDREKRFDQGSILKLLAPSTVLQLAGGNAGFVSASDASEYLLGFARSELRSSEDFKKDERVVHSVFGAGKVLNASDGRIEILFDSSPREGQVFFLEAVRKDLSREVKGGGILFGKAEEDSKFSEIEKILNDQENYSLSDIKFFFIDLLQILISLKKNGKDYAPLLNRMSELLVRVNLDFPSDFSLGMLIDSRQTTAGVMSHEFLGGIFREEAESEVLKILKKRKSKGALSPQIRKLKKGLGIYRSSFSGLDEIREIQKTAPEHEFSITAFSDAGIVLAQDMRHSAAPRFLEISVNFLHTHGNEWPLEPSPQDTQSAINFSQGSYILTFNPDGDEAELAVFDRKARLWRHMVDPQKIADELYKAGFLQKPAARSELRAEKFQKDDRVVHPVFGAGKILNISSAWIEILFDDSPREGQVFSLRAISKKLKLEQKTSAALPKQIDEKQLFKKIETILSDPENYPLRDVIDPFQQLIMISSLSEENYSRLLPRLAALIVRIAFDFPSDFDDPDAGPGLDFKGTTAGTLMAEFLDSKDAGEIGRESKELLKIIKKRKVKTSLDSQKTLLNKGLSVARGPLESLDIIREIQKNAPDREISITVLGDGVIVVAEDMTTESAPRFREISQNFLHTHADQWPLQTSEDDKSSAIRSSYGNYVLTFNRRTDEAELAVFNRESGMWLHILDPQKIADELYKAGFLQKPAARSELRAEEGIPDFKSDEFKTAIINPKTGERIGIELRRTNPFYPYFNLYLSIANKPGGELVSRGHIDFRIYEEKLIIGDVFPFGRAAENLEGRGLAKAIFNWLVYAAKATGRTQIANSGTPSASLAAIYEKLFGDQVSIGRGRMVPVAEIKKKFYDQDVAGKILVFYQGKKESFSLKYEETTGDYRVTATSAEQVPIGQRLRVDEDGKVRLPDGKIEGQVTGFINLMEFEGTPKPETPLFAPKRSELRTVPSLFTPGYKFTEDLAGVQKVMIETIDWLITQGVPGQEVLLAYRDAIAAGAELPAEFAAQGITMRKSPHPVKKGEYLVSLNVSSLSTLIKGILYLHQQDPKGALSYFLENFASKISREANGFKLQSYIEPENEELIKGVNEVLFARRVAETDKVMSIPANPSLLGFLTKYKDEVLKIESLAVAPEFFEGVSQYEFLRWAEGTGLYSPALTEGALKVRSTNFLLNERSRVRQLYQTGGDPAKILSWDLGVITLAVLRMTFARQKVTDGGLRSALYYYLLATGQGTVDANEVQSRINLPPGQFPSDVFLRAADELLPEVQKTVEVWQGRMRSELRAGLDLPDQSARVYAPPAMTPVNAGAVEVINERLSREVARIGLDNILDIVPEWANELAAADPRINADQVISVTQGIIMAYLYEMLPASALDASAPSFFKSAAAVFRSPGEILKTQMLAWWARAFASHLAQLKDEDYRSNYAAAGQSILFEFAEAIDPEVAGLFQSLVDYGHIWSEEHPASLPESPEEAAEFGEGLGTDSLINSFLLPAGTLLLLQPENSKTNTDFNPILLQSFPLGNFSRLRMGANSGWGIIGTETSGASAARLGAHSAAYQTAFVNISRLRERALTSTILLRPEWFSGVNAAALRKTLKENYSSELAVKLKDPKLEPETMRGMDAAVEQLLLKAYSAALTSPDRDQAISAILQGFLNSVFNHESYHLVSNWLDLRKKFGDEEFLAMMIELRASGRPQPQMVFHTIFEMVTALTLPGNEDKSELLSIYARALDVIFPAGKSLTEGKDFRERARLMVSKINGSGGIAALTPNIITQRVTDYFLKSLGQDPVAGTAAMDITYPFKDLLARAQSKAPFSVRPANLPPAFAARSEVRKLSAEAEDAVSNLNKAIASERMTEASAGIEAFEKRMNELKPKLTPAEITAILARLDTSIYFLAQTSGSYSEDVRWSGFEASPVYKETKTRIESILEKYKADFSNKIANAALTVDAVAEGPEGARIIDAAQIYGRLSDDERDALVARIVELFKEHYPRVPPYLAKINIQGQIDLVRANPGGKRFLFYTSQTGQINGYLQYDINSEKKTAYLAYVGVAASEQKKGAGSFLMDTFFSEIKKLNIDKSLWISSGQSPAFYEKYLNAKKSELGADFQRLNDYTVDDLEGFITKLENSPADLGPLFKVNSARSELRSAAQELKTEIINFGGDDAVIVHSAYSEKDYYIEISVRYKDNPLGFTIHRTYDTGRNIRKGEILAEAGKFRDAVMAEIRANPRDFPGKIKETFKGSPQYRFSLKQIDAELRPAADELWSTLWQLNPSFEIVKTPYGVRLEVSVKNPEVSAAREEIIFRVDFNKDLPSDELFSQNLKMEIDLQTAAGKEKIFDVSVLGLDALLAAVRDGFTQTSANEIVLGDLITKWKTSLPPEGAARSELRTGDAKVFFSEITQTENEWFEKLLLTSEGQEKELLQNIQARLQTLLREIDALSKMDDENRIRPFTYLNTRKYSDEPDSSGLQRLEPGQTHRARVGVLPVSGNPMTWAHVMIALESVLALKLDTVIFVSGGRMQHKAVKEKDDVRPTDRMQMIQAAVQDFYPLLRYSDVGLHSSKVGEEYWHGLRELNPDQPADFYYLSAGENRTRAEKIASNLAAAAEDQGLNKENKIHTLTWGVFPRSELGHGDFAQGNLDRILTENEIPLSAVVVEVPEFFDQISSTGYRKSFSPVYVPEKVDRYVRAHGLYGAPAARSEVKIVSVPLRSELRVQTEKPLDRSTREQFKKVIIVSGANFSRELIMLREILPVLEQNFPNAEIESNVPILGLFNFTSGRVKQTDSDYAEYEERTSVNDDFVNKAANGFKPEEVLIIQLESGFLKIRGKNYPLLYIEPHLILFAGLRKMLLRKHLENDDYHAFQKKSFAEFGLEGIDSAKPYFLLPENLSVAVKERVKLLKRQDPRLDFQNKEFGGKPVIFINLFNGMRVDLHEWTEKGEPKWLGWLTEMTERTDAYFVLNGGPESWKESEARAEVWKMQLKLAESSALRGSPNQILPVMPSDTVGLMAMIEIIRETGGFAFTAHSGVLHAFDFSGVRVLASAMDSNYAEYFSPQPNLRVLPKSQKLIMDTVADWLPPQSFFPRSEVRTAPAPKDVKDEIADAGRDLADIWGNGEITAFFDAAIAKLAGPDEDKFDAANNTLNEVLILIGKRITAVSVQVTELVDDGKEDETRPLDNQLDGLEKMQKRIAVIQDRLIDLSEAALRQGRESVADFEASERATQSDFSVLPPSATGSTFFPEDDLEQPETDPENEALDRVFRKAVAQYLKKVLPARYHTDLAGGIRRIGIGMRATVYFADANKRVYKLVPRFGLRNRQVSSSLRVDDDWLAGLAALEKYLGDFSLSMKHVSSPVLPMRKNSRSQIESDEYLLFEQPFGLVVHKDFQRLRKIKSEAQFAVDPGNYTRLRRVARALFELQNRLLTEKSIIVFDMNPKNIVDEGGAAALSDFDLARLVQYDSALQKLEFYDFFKKLGPENYEPAYEEFFIMEFIEKMLYPLVQDAADSAKKYISDTIADEIGRMAAEGQPLARIFYPMINTEEKRAELAEIFSKDDRTRAAELKEFSLRHLNKNIFQYITEGLGRTLPELNIEEVRGQVFAARSEVRTNSAGAPASFDAESLQEELSRLANAVDLNLLPASSRLTSGDKLQIQGIRERLEFIKISVRDEEFLPPFEDAARILRDIQKKVPADAAFDKARGILTSMLEKLSARSEMRESPGVNSYTKESGEMDLVMMELLEKIDSGKVSKTEFENVIGALQGEEKKYIDRFARALTSNGRAPQTILERFVDLFLRGPAGLDAVQDFSVLTVPMTAANSISQEAGTWLKEKIYAIVREVIAEPTSKVGFIAYDSTAGSSQVYLGTSIGVTGMDAAQLKRVLERFEKEVKPELLKMGVKQLEDDLDGGVIGTVEFNNNKKNLTQMISNAKIFAAQTDEVVLPEDVKVQIKSALEREDLAHAAALIEHAVLGKVKTTMAQAEMVQEFQKFMESVPLKQRPPPDPAVLTAVPAAVFNEARIKAQAEYAAEMTDGQFDFHFEEKFEDAQRHFIPLGNFHTRHIPRLDHEVKNVRDLHEELLEMLSLAENGEPISPSEILIRYQEYRLWLGRLLLISNLDTRYNLAFTKEGAQTIIDADNDGSLEVLLSQLEYLYSQTTQTMRDNSFLKWKSILYGLLLPVIFFLWLFKVRYDFFNPDLNPARRTLRDFRKMKGFYLIKFGGDEISLASRGPDGTIVIRAVGDFDKFKRYNEESPRTDFDDNFGIFLDGIHRAAERAGVAKRALSEEEYLRFLQWAHEEILNSTMLDEDEKPIGKVRDFKFQSEQKIQTRGGGMQRLRLWETPDGRVFAVRGNKPSPDVEVYALDGSYLGLLKELEGVSVENLKPHNVTAGLTANTSTGIGENPSNVNEASNKMADYARYQKKKGTQPGSSPDKVRVMTVGQIEEFKKQIGAEDEKPEGARSELRIENEDAEDDGAESLSGYEPVRVTQKRAEGLAELILRKIAAEGRRILEEAEMRPMDRLGINVSRSEVRAAVTLPRAEEFAREFAKVYAILDTVPPAMAGMRGIDRIDDALLGLKAGSFSMFPAANRGALQNWADGLKANFTDIMPGLKIGTLIQSDLIFDGQNHAIIINGKSGGGKSSLSYAFTQMLPGRVKFGSEDKVLILQLPGHLLAASAFSYGQIRARAFNPPGAPRSHTMPVDELISAAPLTAWVHIESSKPEAILTGQGLPFWLSAYVPPSEPLAEPLISLKVEHMIGTNPPAGTSQNFGELARKLEPILFPPVVTGTGPAAQSGQTDGDKDEPSARSEIRASKLPPGIFYHLILGLVLFFISPWITAPAGQSPREVQRTEMKKFSGSPFFSKLKERMTAYFPEFNSRRKPPYSPPVPKKGPPSLFNEPLRSAANEIEILSIEPLETGESHAVYEQVNPALTEMPESKALQFADKIERSFYGSPELPGITADEFGKFLKDRKKPVKTALDILKLVTPVMSYEQAADFIDQMIESSGRWELSGARYELVQALYTAGEGIVLSSEKAGGTKSQEFAKKIEDSIFGGFEKPADIAEELAEFLNGREKPVKFVLSVFKHLPPFLTYEQSENFVDHLIESSGRWELSGARFELIEALYQSTARSELRATEEEALARFFAQRLVEYNHEKAFIALRNTVQALREAIIARGKNLKGRKIFDETSEKLIKAVVSELARVRRLKEESYEYLAVTTGKVPEIPKMSPEEAALFAEAEELLDEARFLSRSELRQMSGLEEKAQELYNQSIMENDFAWLAGEKERNETADLVLEALLAGPEEEEARALVLLFLRQVKMPEANAEPNPVPNLFLDVFWSRAARLSAAERRRVNMLVGAEFLEGTGPFDMDREVHQATRIALNNYYTKITRALHELLLEARKKAGQRIKELQAKKEPGNYDQNIIAGYRWLQTQYNGAPWEALSKLNWLPMEMQNGDEKKLMDIYFRLIPKLPQVIEGNMALTDLLHINRSSFYRLRKDWYRTLRESVKTTVRKAVAQAAAEGQKTKVVIQLGVAGAAGGQEPITIAIETDKAMKELESEGISSQDADFVLHVFDRPSPFYERLGKNTIVYTEDLMPKEAGNEGLYFEKRQVTSDKEIKASEGLIGGFRRSAYLNSKMRFHKLDLLKEETFQIPEELQDGGLDYFMIHEVLQYVLPGQMERPENFEQTMGSMKQFLDTLIRPQGIMSIQGRPSDQDTRAEKAVREVLANGRQPLSRSEARALVNGEWDADQIKRITNFTDRPGPKIILAGGNSTAGKTTLRRYLRDDLSLADDYHMADGKIIQNILEGIDSEVYPDDSPYGLLKEYLAAKKGGVNLAQFQLPSFLLAMKDRLFTGKKQLLFIEYVGADAWLSDPSGWKPLASEDSADFLNIPVLKVTVEKGANEKRTLSFKESTLGAEKTRARSETRASAETAQTISAVLGTGLDRNSFTVQQLAAVMKIGKAAAENKVALAVREGYFVRRGTRGNYTYSFTSTAENEFYNPPALMDVRRSWPARIREGNLLHELHRPFGDRVEDVRFMADEKQTRDAVAFLLRIPRPEAAAKIRRIREMIRGSIKGGIFTKPAENSPWLWVLPAGITGSERLFVVNLETERVLNADLEIPLNDSGTRYEISGNFLFNLHNYTVSVFYFDENRIVPVPFPEGERASTFFADASQVRVRPSDNPRLTRPEDYPVAVTLESLTGRVMPGNARSEVRAADLVTELKGFIKESWDEMSLVQQEWLRQMLWNFEGKFLSAEGRRFIAKRLNMAALGKGKLLFPNISEGTLHARSILSHLGNNQIQEADRAALLSYVRTLGEPTFAEARARAAYPSLGPWRKMKSSPGILPVLTRENLDAFFNRVEVRQWNNVPPPSPLILKDLWIEEGVSAIDLRWAQLVRVVRKYEELDWMLEGADEKVKDLIRTSLKEVDPIYKAQGLPGILKYLEYMRRIAGFEKEISVTQVRRSEPGERGPFANANAILSIQYAPDGRSFVTTSARYIVKWNADNGEEIFRKEVQYYPRAVSHSPSGERILTGGDLGQMVMWDAAGNQIWRTSHAELSHIIADPFSPDGLRVAASGAGSKNILVRNAETGDLIWDKAFNLGELRSVYSPDGRTLAVGGNGSVILLDAETGREIWRTAQWPLDLSSGPRRSGSIVNAISFSPDGLSIVTATGDEGIVMWEAQTGTRIWQGESGRRIGHSLPIQGLSYSPNGEWIVTAGADSRVILWDAWTGRQIWRSELGDDAISSVHFSPDGKSFVTGGYDGRTVTWSLGMVSAAARSEVRSSENKDEGKDIAAKVREESPVIDWTWPGRLKVFQSRAVALLTEKRTAAGKTKADPVTVIDIGIGGKTREDEDAAGVTVFDLVRELKLAGYTNIIVYGVDNHAPNVVSAAAALQTQDDIKNDPQIKLEFREGNIFEFEKFGLRGDVILSSNTLFYYPPEEVLAVRERLSKLIEPYGFLGFAAVREADHVLYSIYGSNNQLEVSYTQYPGQPGGVPVESLTEDVFQQVVENRHIARAELRYAAAVVLRAVTDEKINEEERGTAAKILAEAGADAAVRELEDLKLKMMNQFPAAVSGTIDGLISALSSLPSGGVDIAYSVEGRSSLEIQDFVNAVKRLGQIKRVLISDEEKVPEELTASLREAGVMVSRVNFKRPGVEFSGNQTYAGFVTAGEVESAPSFVPIISLETESLAGSDAARLVIALQTAVALLVANEISEERKGYKLKPAELLTKYKLFEGFENAVISGDGQNIRISGAGVMAYLQYQAAQALARSA